MRCRNCGSTAQLRPIAETDGSNGIKSIFYQCGCGCTIKETWQKIDVECRSPHGKKNLKKVLDK